LPGEGSRREFTVVLRRFGHIECGGTLERFAGDGVMMIFNDPTLQAVLMALEDVQ
jgi:class 3 adenylate cyclase